MCLIQSEKQPDPEFKPLGIQSSEKYICAHCEIQLYQEDPILRKQ